MEIVLIGRRRDHRRDRMKRQYPISDTQIALIRSELQHMKQNCISTPDTEANYNNIVNVLIEVAGA